MTIGGVLIFSQTIEFLLRIGCWGRLWVLAGVANGDWMLWCFDRKHSLCTVLVVQECLYTLLKLHSLFILIINHPLIAWPWTLSVLFQHSIDWPLLCWQFLLIMLHMNYLGFMMTTTMTMMTVWKDCIHKVTPPPPCVIEGRLKRSLLNASQFAFHLIMMMMLISIMVTSRLSLVGFNYCH